MELYEMLPLDREDESEVYAMALTDNPAIQQSYIYLSANDREIQVKLNEEQKMLYTPVLIPDQTIERLRKNGEQYGIVWRREAIKLIAQNYLSKGYNLRSWNNEHRSWDKLEGISVVESWVKEDTTHDKSVKLGMDHPVGTWYVGIKLYNDDIVADVKAGKWKGISLEGNFYEKPIEAVTNLKSINPISNKNAQNMKNEALTKVSELLKAASEAIKPKEQKLGSSEIDGGGTVYFEGETLEVGSNVYSDEAMETPAPDGTHNLASGKVVVVAEGIAQSVEDAPEPASEELTTEQLAGSVEEFAGVISEMAEAMAALGERLGKVEDAVGITGDATEEAIVEMSKAHAKLSKELEALKSKPAKESVKEREVSLSDDENSALAKFQERRVM